MSATTRKSHVATGTRNTGKSHVSACQLRLIHFIAWVLHVSLCIIVDKQAGTGISASTVPGNGVMVNGKFPTISMESGKL